ncbi:hypothetical protein [Tessaracoccus sp. OH4464_COT-324]|uniref:hypothetical protein n=1 Tax=Tessaracoccus sp. OH4464_COT-324 TaxID=2491059 RepID=UPI000F63AD98|nr:hypothetical protein [Tessaracoccus sp. OH4464_COT-324]RRD46815.1 hypothetical protein EII42_05110 [Tessaracoccus sp. OH4464_COT-324]
MTEDWNSTFETPQIKSLLQLAEAQFTAYGPQGASVTVDSTGGVVDVVFGSSDLPGDVGSFLVGAYNDALTSAESAARTIGLATAQLAPEVEEAIREPGDPTGTLPEEHRADSADGKASATVDAVRMRLVALYLEDVEDATRRSVGEAIDAAFSMARGLEGQSFNSVSNEVMTNLSKAISALEGNLSQISDSVSQAMRNLD